MTARLPFRPCAPVLAALLLVACSRDAPPPPVPATEAPPPAAAKPKNDGTPRILAEAVNGVHIQYRLYGEGPVLVVLVHGWSCDSNYWNAQLPDLRAKYTVATVDLAGHGGSGANRDDWSMAEFGDDVVRVVEALKEYPRVVLVGHSMGGPVAVEAARRLKGRVVGVIGVDTLQAAGLPPTPPAQLAKLLVPFEQDFIGATRGFVTQNFFTPKSDPALVRRIADDMSLAPPQVALPAMRALGGWDAAPAIADAGVPIVLINAATPPTDGERLGKLIPQFKLVTLDGVGHFLMMEDPARFNPLLIAEIDRLATAPAAGG